MQGVSWKILPAPTCAAGTLCALLRMESGPQTLPSSPHIHAHLSRGRAPAHPSHTSSCLLSECSWCQASGCLRLNEVQGRPDTPSALW